MYKIVIRKRAEKDLNDAAKWYNKKQKGLGTRLTKEVKNTIEFIAENQKGAIKRDHGLRTAKVKTFPYLIHYSVIHAQKTILIATIFNSSRDSDNWPQEAE